MEKKKSKGLLFSALFAPKSNSGCCNVQFEEVPEGKIYTEEIKADLKESDINECNESFENKNKEDSSKSGRCC